MGIAQRLNHSSQISVIYAHVGVVDDKVLVLGFAFHQSQFGDLVVDDGVAGAVEQPDLSLRKVLHQFLDYRHRRIGLVCHAENELVLWIVLATEASKVFISVRI